MKYDVMREHIGDRRYQKGDVRVADPATVGHLIKSGTLAAQKGEKTDVKAAPKPQNKAEQPPVNKADQ